MNIKNILISQSQTDKAAYDALETKYGVKVHFKPFITIKPVSMKVFRAQKVNILSYTAIIFTSKNAVDIFFNFCKELRIEMPADMKYFCVNETTANYIQHHVQMRKRKVFVGKGNNQDLFPLFKKHSSEKYLYPCSEIRKSDIPDFMKQNNILCKELIIYETVSADLKDLNINDYQLIAFFSPSGVTALKENFPNYKQDNTLFAAFGSTTAKAIQEANFRVDIQAPIPQIPSMVGAIELKLRELSDPKSFKKYLKQLETKIEQQQEEERKLKEQKEREKLLKQKEKQLKKQTISKKKHPHQVITQIDSTNSFPNNDNNISSLELNNKTSTKSTKNESQSNPYKKTNNESEKNVSKPTSEIKTSNAEKKQNNLSQKLKEKNELESKSQDKNTLKNASLVKKTEKLTNENTSLPTQFKKTASKSVTPKSSSQKSKQK
ncbi:MAG: uroporphyrinogen-III synthase [Bacteroidia bacterium]|nr:uroporphyrinogen-III synthase [Bacteroidia bacterium]